MQKHVSLAAIFGLMMSISLLPTSEAKRLGGSSGLLADDWRNATKRASGSVVPRPKVITHDNDLDYLEIEPTRFEINLLDAVDNCSMCHMMRKRYRNRLLFRDVAPEPKDDPHFGMRRRVGSLTSVELVAKGQQFNCESRPHSQMDESYELVVESPARYNLTSGHIHAQIRSNSSWGLLRGLETLSQLIFEVSPRSRRFGILPVRIEDEPRFKHRGFMLDTARHFISVDKIFNILDAMNADKLNVFHWHLVDDQSFTFTSPSYPQLSKLSSFRPNLVYSPRDIQNVILYAAMLGIRVIPELDTPGHTYALRHIKGLLSDCFDSESGQPNGDFGPVDPTREANYKIIDRLLQDFVDVFHDDDFHAGGDEVDFGCWKSNKRIIEWMQANNLSGNYEQLTNYFMSRLHELVHNKGKKMIVWQEVFDLGANLPRDNVVIQVWKNINDKLGYMKELSKVVKAGYSALLSSCWYLNYIDYAQDWQKFYQCDPRDTRWISAEDEQLVLGGEICMWSEYVDDTNVISRTWPRASAAAERLWSPAESNKINEFLPRLEQHRCHLLRRGLQAEPVNGPGYC